MNSIAIRAVGLLLLFLVAPELDARTETDDPGVVAALDEIFADYDSARTPGCAVSVEREGRPLVERAYGMANLESGMANSPGTIFEAGSVSKQFTAAAVVLLALDGKLAIEDDVRDYIPELPDYGATITLRHMFTHTSGLRDWGSVAGISGWGRGARTHNHDHVLDILSRQSALNFEPGHEYSYSNSGYNLLAIIVDRVSGMSFADFSREHIFEPLGLDQTEWRDDYRRIVPGRSSAYSPSGEGFRINHPIENVHGNGGLLTTVGDLQRWNEHLRSGTLGEAFMAEMHTRGVLNSGEQIHYASGLQFGSQQGVTRISHTGSTAGYRAYLALFPDDGLSLALLCNITTASPASLGARVADVFLPVGAISDSDDSAESSGEEATATGVDAPSTADLATYEGAYYSDDAETTLRVSVENGELVVHRRPATRVTLAPDGESDTFNGSLGTIRFIRDGNGQVSQMSLSQSRVYDMRFARVPDGGARSPDS